MKICNTSDAERVLRPEYRWNREYVKMLLLSSQCEMLGIYSCGKGTRYEVTMDAVGFLQKARKDHPAGRLFLIISHSHPKDVFPKASTEDRICTERIIELAEKCDIKVIDHIILSPSHYLSMREEGLLDAIRKEPRPSDVSKLSSFIRKLKR